VFLQYFDTVGWVLRPVKNRRPYNLYCVGGDVKPCSINQSVVLHCVQKKNTHSHFLSYLHELFVDLNKNCSEYTQGLADYENVKIRY